MSESNQYAIRDEFKKIPSVNLRFNALVIFLLNLIIRVTRFLQKRSYDLVLTEHNIARSDGSSIDVKVMTPDNIGPDAPALIYLHGGGFALTYAGLHLDSAERYANEAGCVVVFVCYRLAKRHPFPAGFNDAFAAVDWLLDNAADLGIDSDRIAVGGDSAGGALAAGVAQKCRDTSRVNLCAQLLIYPVMDSRCVTESAQTFTDVPLWNSVSNRRMWALYLRDFDTQSPPDYAAPGLGDAAGLPATYIETAEFDPLRDEALNFGRKLAAAGNTPVLNETPGTIHGYDGAGDSDIARRSMQKRIEFLRSAFA